MSTTTTELPESLPSRLRRSIDREAKLAALRAEREAQEDASIATRPASMTESGSDADLIDLPVYRPSVEDAALDRFLDGLDILDVYERCCPEKSLPRNARSRTGEVQVRCPNPAHPDNTPSASINRAEGVGFCHVCETGFDKFDIAACWFGLDTRGSDFPKLKRALAEMFGYVNAPTTPEHGCPDPVRTSTATQSGESGWGALVPLDDATLAECPVHLLPDVYRSMCLALRDELLVPTDLPTTLMFGITSGASAGRLKIDVTDSWSEPAVLWGVVAMPSGTNKSTVLGRVDEPFREFDKTRAAAAAKDHARDMERWNAAKAAVDEASKKLAKAGPDQREELERALEEAVTYREGLTVRPIPKMFIEDTTPEQAVSILAEQPFGGTTLVSDEAGWLGNTKRYANDENLDAFLKANSGSPIIVDRKSSGRVQIGRPQLAIATTIQTGALAKFRANDEWRYRGMHARMLLAVPEPTFERDWSTAKAMPRDVQAAYGAAVATLLDGFEGRGYMTLRLTPDAAQRVMPMWANEVEAMKRPGGSLADALDFAGKLRGTVVRLAGVLHLMEHNVAGFDRDIDLDTVEKAIEIARYYISHHRVAMGLTDTGVDTTMALKIAAWIRRPGRASFVTKDIQKGLHQKAGKELAAAIALLVEHNYIRPGARSGRYDTNPALFATA